MKVLFLNPPTDEISEIRVEPYSIGFLTLYTLSLNEGFETKISYMKSMLEIKNIYFNEFDVLALPCYTAQRKFVFEIARYAKTTNRKIQTIIGGPHVTGIEERILAFYPECDFVITGQAEVAFVMLLNCIEHSCSDLSGIASLTWRSGRSIIKNRVSFNIDLSKIPIINYPNKYFSLYGNYMRDFKTFGEKKRSAISFSRGCNFDCIFCVNKPTFGMQQYVPLENTKQQIFELITRRGIKNFYVTDENFCFNAEIATEISKYLISLDEKLSWNCSARGERIKPELLFLMKQAGCDLLTVGIESGSQSVLNKIKKRYDVSSLIGSLRQIKQFGIELRVTINLGLEMSETDLLETAHIINNIKPNKIQIYYFMVYPGTELYEISKREKLLSDEFWFSNGNIVPYFTLFRTEEENNRNLLKLYEAIKAHKIFLRDGMESQTISLKW